jgi:hypothetical protein
VLTYTFPLLVLEMKEISRGLKPEIIRAGNVRAKARTYLRSKSWLVSEAKAGSDATSVSATTVSEATESAAYGGLGGGEAFAGDLG